MCRRFELSASAGAVLVALLLATVGRAEEKNPRAAEADINVRFAQASLRVAEAELAQVVDANKKVPSAVSEAELRRLKHTVELAQLQLERAKLQAKEAVQTEPVQQRIALTPDSKATATIRQALDEQSRAEFVNTPLADIAQYFSDTHKIPVRLDRKALDDAGVSGDVKITFSLIGVSLRSILNLMLKELDLTFIIDDEVLLITSRDEASQHMEVVVYDVSDLVKTEVTNGDGPELWDSLIETITSTVGITTWDEVGGPGSIAYLHGTLTISQTQAIHAEIASFLAALRKLRAAQSPQPARVDDPERVSLRVYNVDVPLRPVAVASSADRSAVSGDKQSAKQTLNQFGGGEKTPRGQSEGGLGSGASAPASAPSKRETVTYTPDSNYLEAMANAITSTIEPASWQRVGGEGVIQALPANENGVGKLIIKQTGAVHAEISRLLKQMAPRDHGGTGVMICW
jgi:hypothetical protein